MRLKFWIFKPKAECFIIKIWTNSSLPWQENIGVLPFYGPWDELQFGKLCAKNCRWNSRISPCLFLFFLFSPLSLSPKPDLVLVLETGETFWTLLVITQIYLYLCFFNYLCKIPITFNNYSFILILSIFSHLHTYIHY